VVTETGGRGDSLARVGPGYVVFVPDTAVGDEPTVRTTTGRENVACGEAVAG
jgi:predicted RNA-binding protein with TRAM domain